jgi:hypothetical protein
MNNEPVAWIGETLMGRQYINGQKGILPVGTPLYTHPANEYKPNQTLECSFNLAGFKPPAKTLTDEEIKALWKPMPDTKTYDSDILQFARAILKKAQEK